jgi:hypothetical protein
LAAYQFAGIGSSRIDIHSARAVGRRTFWLQPVEQDIGQAAGSAAIRFDVVSDLRVQVKQDRSPSGRLRPVDRITVKMSGPAGARPWPRIRACCARPNENASAGSLAIICNPVVLDIPDSEQKLEYGLAAAVLSFVSFSTKRIAILLSHVFFQLPHRILPFCYALGGIISTQPQNDLTVADNYGIDNY